MYIEGVIALYVSYCVVIQELIMKPLPTVKFRKEPEEHDYPAAKDFLSLFLPDRLADLAVDKLKTAPMTKRKSKDILRASGHDPLDYENAHVRKNISKMDRGKALSPILLVKWNGTLFIADGFHRTCAVYLRDEDIEIPCKLVEVS